MAKKEEQHCLACGVPGSVSDLEVAQAYGLQTIRCVDPVTCRERAQKLGIWKNTTIV